MITLENEFLLVTINEKGAEIQSIIDKKSGYEFIWQADKDHWNRSSPVLFPIVGSLKDNTYYVEDYQYFLSRHGFARDNDFTVQNHQETTASFNLKSSPLTLLDYPFEFSLQINYVLFYNQITVSYEILNPSDKETLYYSIGGHPAFNIATYKNESGHLDYHEIFVEFEPCGHYLKIPLNRKGLTRLSKAKYEECVKLSLKHTDFRKDALIYQIGDQTSVTLHNPVDQVRIKIKPNNMGWIGIWSTYPVFSPFVCIEPWAGIADDEASQGQFIEKNGIQSLNPHQIKTHSFTMDFIKEAE